MRDVNYAEIRKAMTAADFQPLDWIDPAESPERRAVLEGLTQRSHQIIASEIRDEGDDGEHAYITFTAASSAPLARNTIIGPIREWLNFSGLDESRLDRKRMPLLDSHDTSTTRSNIGTIVEHRVVKRDRVDVLEVKAKFYLGRERSREAYEDIRAGLVNNISIGYSPVMPGGVEYKWHDERADFDESKDFVADVIFRKWLVTEVSLVPVPADDTIGLGRGLADDLRRSYENFILTARSNAMTEQNNTEQEQAIATEAAAEQEQEQAREAAPQAEAPQAAAAPQAIAEASRDFSGEGLKFLAKNASKLRQQGITAEQHAKLVDEASDGEGLTAEQVQARCWALLESRDMQAAPIGKGQAPAGRASGKPHQQFSMYRLIRGLLNRKIDGIEAEVVRDYEKSIDPNKAPQHGGQDFSVRIPFAAFGMDAETRNIINSEWHKPHRGLQFKEAEARAFQVGTGTPAGHFHQVFDESWFVEALVADAMTLQHVKRLSSQLTQDRVGVTETGTLSTYHSATEISQRTESTGLSFANRTMKWHQINARVDVTQRTLDQSNYFMSEVMSVMRRDLIRGVNQTLLTGSGSSGIPQGISNFPSINVVAIGTNGGQPDYGHVVDMRSTIEAANANLAMGKYVMTPEIKARLQQTPRFTGSAGSVADRIIQSPQPGVNQIDGYDVITENNLPKNLSKGTGTNLHMMIFGNLGDIELGQFSGIELLADPYSAAETSHIRFYLRYAYDISPRHVDSVCITKDAQV